MLKFRPHHFLCTLGFQGKGYSPGFVANFQPIADRLRGPGGDDEPIEVVERTDSICQPCPNRTEENCSSEAKIRSLDASHQALLDLRAGEVLTWGEAQARIAERVTPAAFHEACAPCAWRTLGVCEAALQELRARAGRGGSE